jgi:hypothetical protein
MNGGMHVPHSEEEICGIAILEGCLSIPGNLIFAE